MRSFIFVVGACAFAAACGRGNGSTSMSTRPVVSVIGCVSQQGNDLVLTAVNRSVGTSGSTTGSPGTSGSSDAMHHQYRLVDEAHTGVDRFVDRQVQITGKVEQAGSDVPTRPTIRVTQLSSMGACP